MGNTDATKKPYKSWTSYAHSLNDEFFGTQESLRIGNNLLLYQLTNGGWAKNVDMAKELDEKEQEAAVRGKTHLEQSTIDNNATTTEIIFLSRLYQATKEEKYKTAVLKGISYLFEAQYDNGGWPQFYPSNTEYRAHVTYNDNAMINVMKMMRDISKGKQPFSFLSDSIRQKANDAVDKGIECIVKTQVERNGKPTVWCAQHDENTLQPAKARSYELESLSGMESVNIVLFLMSVENPTQEIANSIEGAVEWFKNSMITGMKITHFTNDEGMSDYRIEPCTDNDSSCKPLWARFYTLEDNRPFFCDRDGIKRYDVSEIGHERRNGYSWYGSQGLRVLEQYDKWKTSHNLTNSIIY